MTYDQAQSRRLGQRLPVENPGIRLVTFSDLPEVGYMGQLVYNISYDRLMVYDGAAWQDIGDSSSSRTFVAETDPALEPDNGVTNGDEWFQPSTGYVRIRYAGDWAPPQLAPDTVGNPQLIEDAVSGAEIQDDAIGVKHTIVGSHYYSADPEVEDAYVEVTQIGTQGVVLFTYGIGEDFKGYITTEVDASHPVLLFSSGTMSTDPDDAAQLRMYGAGTNPKKAELNCDLSADGISIADLQAQITALEARVTALETP